jgi:hypothetical protein
MANYRAATPGEATSAGRHDRVVERLVHRPMRLAVSIVLMALMIAATFGLLATMLQGARGTDLRCTKANQVGACVITRDYGIFTTHREIPLTRIRTAIVEETRAKNRTLYTTTLLLDDAEKVPVGRPRASDQDAQVSRVELARFLDEPTDTSFGYRYAPQRLGLSAALGAIIVAFVFALALVLLQRMEIVVDGVGGRFLVVHRRWPLTPIEHDFELTHVLGARVETVGFGGRKQHFVVIDRVAAEPLPLFGSTSGGDRAHHERSARAISEAIARVKSGRG